MRTFADACGDFFIFTGLGLMVYSLAIYFIEKKKLK